MAGPAERDATLIAASRAELYRSIAGGLLHDLRNPSQVLLLALPDVEAGMSEDDVQFVRESVQGGMERLSRTITVLDRLFFSDTAQNGASLAGVVELAGALDRLQRADASVKVTLPAAVAEIPLPGREADLVHAMMNLVMNAKESVEAAGGGTVTVTVADDGGHVVMDVLDNGGGLDGEARDRAFEPGFTTRGMGRMGLGLTVARALVTPLGGRVTLDAEAAGVRSRITLPEALTPPSG